MFPLHFCRRCDDDGSSNQSMKPTAPPRNAFKVFATTPWISSRCPATLVRFASSRSRTPAVMLFTLTVAYLFFVRGTVCEDDRHI